MTAGKQYGWSSLRLKLILASTLVEFVMLGVLVWNSARIVDQAMTKGIERRVEMLTPLLNASLAPALAQRDYATLDELLERVVHSETLVYVEVRDVLNRSVSVRGAAPAQDIEDLDMQTGGDVFDRIADVTVAGQVIGRMRYGLNVSLLEATVTALQEQGWAIAGAEMVLTFLLLAGLGFVLTRNLRELADAARRIEAGDYSVRVPDQGRDEIAEVGRAFNTMANNVERQLKSLRENQSLLDAIVNNSAAVIAVKDIDGTILLANREYERVFGVTQTQVCGKTEREILPADIAVRLRANDERVIQRKTVIHFEETLDQADGPHVYVTVRFPLLDESQTVRAIAAISTDITQRKRVEDALRALASGISLHAGEEFYASLVRYLAEMLNADHAFVGKLNDDGRSIKTLANYAHGKVVGDIEYALTDTSCAQIVGQKIRVFPRDVRRLFPKDELLVEMHAEAYVGAPLFDSADRPLGIIAVLSTQPMTDTSYAESLMKVFAVRAASEMERELAEGKVRSLNAQLEQRVRERTRDLESANAELESFSYSVSHDLRSPLRAINGFSQALMEEYAESLDATARGYLSRVCAATQRMGDLIDDMLELSRVSRHELNRGRVDLGEIARDIVAHLQAQAPRRRIAWDIKGDLAVTGDAGLLRIALDNLLENAWKYTSQRESAHVTVSAVYLGGERVFCVRDDGVGFDMQYVHKLFGAFQRLHALHEFPGTGIGLATVARVIQRHGGRIWAEGALNQGACFYFTIPGGGEAICEI